MSFFPGIANTGLPYESPENMARWQHFAVSFCLLGGLNTSLSGDVLSCNIFQNLPGLHLGSSVRFLQWEDPVESTWHGYLTISFWTILWNLISILFMLQNCNMLKTRYVLSSIKSHRIQLLFFISYSIGFLSVFSRPFVYKRDGLQGVPVCENGVIPSLSWLYSERPDQQQLPSFPE